MKHYSWNTLFKTIYPPFFLVTVVLLCVTLLYFVNQLTYEKRVYNELQENNLAIQKIYPHNDLKPLEWIELSNNKQITQYAKLPEEQAYLLTLLTSGYGGVIRLVALYSERGKLLKALVVDHSETDGIGSHITDENYMEKLIGFGEEIPIPTTKRKVAAEYVDAISGATVSFHAVSSALQEGSSFVKQLSQTKETL